LIRVSDDTHLWGNRYDRVLEDIFVIQSEVAENVARAMGVTLAPGERAAMASVSTSNMEAYDFYLRGLELVGRGQARIDQEGAVRMFQSAVDRDPAFPLALAQLAKAHLSLYFYFGRFDVPPELSHLKSAKEVLDRISSIGADLPETLVARGYYTYWGLDDLEPALVDFRRAVALQPSSVPAHFGVLFVLRRLGRWNESAEQIPKFSCNAVRLR
jgi:tetratricopeptide (TPR) repeat protein